MSKNSEIVKDSVVTNNNITETIIESGGTTMAKKGIEKSETVVYLGPSIANVVEHGTIFENGIVTNILEEKITQKPMLKSLLVPLSRLAKAREELRNEDSATSKLYTKALEK